RRFLRMGRARGRDEDRGEYRPLERRGDRHVVTGLPRRGIEIENVAGHQVNARMSPVAGVRAAIDVQGLAGHERGRLQVQDGADGTPLTGWPTSVVVRFTMCPPPCVSICLTARCEMWKNPARFTEILRVKSASVYSVNGLEMKIPALLTSVSTRPNAATASPT